MNKYFLKFPLDQFNPQYLVSVDEIYHSSWVKRKIRRIEILREIISNLWPEGHPSKLIHVTGTNGKGSVIHYLEQALPGKTGSWTGPHVFDYRERFHINCKIPSKDEISTVYREILLPLQKSIIKDNADNALTFAELGILLSLVLFEKNKVEWGMMEVGAGGRYTQLMALDVKACVLTNIGKDHPKTLGSEIWERAMEKSGIARKGVPFFTSANEPALSYVTKTAVSQGAPVHEVKLNDKDTENTAEPLFKLLNKKLAETVIKHFYPESSDLKPLMKKLLTSRYWKFRENIIVDVAHNINKISSLKEQLIKEFPDRKFHFLLGLSRNRNPAETFLPLREMAETITFTSASYAGIDPEELLRDVSGAGYKNVSSIKDPSEAFNAVCKTAKKDEIIVITGSAYMIDQVLNPDPYMKHLNRTFGRRQ